MASKKLRMDLAGLRLKSFETSTEGGTHRGTVRGNESGCEYCTTETACGGCTVCTFMTAGATTETCGPTGWNASTTDEYFSPC